MEYLVSKSSFKAKALEYLRHVESTGTELVITDNGKPVLKIVPYTRGPAAALRTLRGSVIRYDEPLEPVGLEDWEPCEPIDLAREPSDRAREETYRARQEMTLAREPDGSAREPGDRAGEEGYPSSRAERPGSRGDDPVSGAERSGSRGEVPRSRAE